LGVIQSRTFDGRDNATGGVPLGWQGTGKTRPTSIPTDYTKFLNPNGLRGTRLGVTRVGLSGFTNVPTPQPVLDAIEDAFTALSAAAQQLSTWTPRASSLLRLMASSWCCSSTSGTTGKPISPLAPASPLPAARCSPRSPSTTRTLQVPSGMVFGVPLGISFFGTAFKEPKLITLASGFEAATQVRARNLPTFSTVPFNNIQGTTVLRPKGRSAPVPTDTHRRMPHGV